MKKHIFVAVLIIACLTVSLLVFSANAASDDPSESYVKQTAPAEDPSIDLWFEHSFKKVLTSDTVHSGMDTYSAYMAKNEIENIQFVLYSDNTVSGLSADVTAFRDADGNEISAEIYYEMYVTVEGIREEFVHGANAQSTPIREGETPDPVYPLKTIGNRFQLNGGKSQAFFIKLRTSESTPSGWYTASLEIKNSGGEVVKCADVFCYVWNFALSEETAFQTALFLNNDTTYGGTYEKFYDYFLENRLSCMDLPGGLYADNPYLTNPRVSAIRVTYGGGGYNKSYGEIGTAVEYYRYLDVYNDLSVSEHWDEIKDKLYFYTADEPVGAVWNKLTGSKNMTADDIVTFYGHLENYWEAPMATVPYHENHPYPYFHYTKPMESYEDYELTDSTQAMLDGGGVSIWCPQIYAFTPQYELDRAGYKGANGEPVRELSATISNLYTYGTNNSPSGTVGVDMFYGTGYYNWNNIFGEYSDRVYSAMAMAERDGTVANSRLWTYGAGGNYCYSYANHLIENTGLQTKIMFWQCYQNDVEGYLYYSVNGWSEVDDMYGTVTVDKTQTGSFSACEWRTNRLNYLDDTFYGNGVLFYGATQAKIRGVKDYVGTLRVELMRDGVEEYQMLTMLEELLGERAAKDTVARISKNIVNYVSLPAFDRSGFDSSMDEYDIMALVRRDMGDTIEAETLKGACDHRFDGGVVETEPTCLEVGYTVYTCRDCGARYDEYIPALHTEGSCFEYISGKGATCTEDGSEIYGCTVCGYKKTVNTKAFHSDKSCMRYEKATDSVHGVYCSVCDEKLSANEHIMFTKDTAGCTVGGEYVEYCHYCGEERSTGVSTEAKGHSYSDGFCEACGEADPDYEKPADDVIIGDLDGDGKVNAKDSNILKRLVSGALDPTEMQKKAGDINGDNAVNAIDANLITRLAAGT